jgi:hypothetical protein
MNIFNELTAICIGSFIGNKASEFISTKKKPSKKAFELRIDLTEPDKDTFYSIQDALKRHKNIEISLVGGSCRCNPDYAINWYYALMQRPKDSFVSIRTHSNCKESAMAIVVACDQIIPRYGSWYEIPSIEEIAEEFEEFEFRSTQRQKVSYTNLRLLHRILGQYLEIPSCLDKQMPMAGLSELGLPVLEVTKDSYKLPIEVG